MDAILKKKYTNRDSTVDILAAIDILATDKHTRVLLVDHCEWLEEKLSEIARLTGILKRRKKL